MNTRTVIRRPKALLAGLALVLTAGCGTVPLDGASALAPVENRSPTGNPVAVPAGGTGASGGAASTPPQSQVATVDLGRVGAGAAGASNSNLVSAELLAATRQRVIYFDYNSFSIRDEFKPTLDGHARMLSTYRGNRMVVEGHTDDRGGREYNLALGQKRAAAVVQNLALLGVKTEQLEAVSYGKERPAAQGADENSHAKNRRAELKDR